MLTIVNAFCRERGVVLASIDTADKSNEITVLPQLLRALDVKGCIVTLDAMRCQKAIVAQIIDQQGDYLISLKGNQGNLHADVAEFFEAHEQADPDFREPDFEAEVYEYEEKNRGRHYRRKVVVTSDFCPGLEGPSGLPAYALRDYGGHDGGHDGGQVRRSSHRVKGTG